MAERLIHLKTGDRQVLSQDARKRIDRLHAALEEEGIVAKGDSITYVVGFDPNLQAGSVGREIEVKEIFRGADDAIDSLTDRYTVDF